MNRFNRNQPPRRVPIAGFPKVDRTHPLARGLVGCWLPGISGIDLSGTCPPMTLTQNSGAQAPKNVNLEGPVFTGAVSGAGGNALSCIAPAAYKGWNDFSLYYRGPRGTGNGNSTTCPMLDVTYDDAVTSPFTVVAIGGMGDVTLADVGVQWNEGSGLKTSTTVVNVSALSAHQIISVLGTFSVGQNPLLYSSGTLVGGATAWGSSSQAATTATTTITINGWIATARYTPSSCNIACAWNRSLSASEAAVLDRDPYAFLIMPPMLVGAAAAAGFLAAWAQQSNLPVLGTGTY